MCGETYCLDEELIDHSIPLARYMFLPANVHNSKIQFNPRNQINKCNRQMFIFKNYFDFSSTAFCGISCFFRLHHYD